MTPQEVEARLTELPTQATVGALIAAMDGDHAWSVVSAQARGRLVWAEFTHLPSGTVLTLAPEDLREEKPSAADGDGAPRRPPGDGDDAETA